MLHRGPVMALAALPSAQGALALSGGQDAALLLSSVPALSAGAADNGASAAAQPLVAYRCGTPVGPPPQHAQDPLVYCVLGVLIPFTAVASCADMWHCV